MSTRARKWASASRWLACGGVFLFAGCAVQMILIWLGSGFAFAVGICFGAWMLRFLLRRDDSAAVETRDFWQKQHDQNERLLELREDANRIASQQLQVLLDAVNSRR